MGVQEILLLIEQEIIRLKKAKELLREVEQTSQGRAQSKPALRLIKKKNLTPEGRRRIVEAVKKRWALRNKQPGNSSTASDGPL